MSTPFLGEIRMVPFNFAPEGWALCNGQLLAITTNVALFSLLGTYYGGDGISNFALPNFQGRVPVHQGTGPGQTYELGETTGSETVNLTIDQLPPHFHDIHASTDAPSKTVPTDGVLGASNIFCPKTDDNTGMQVTGKTGLGSAVSVVQPLLCVNFIIAMSGIFPSRN